MNLADLFAPVERLITEHASASVLRDHVGLLRTKLELIVQENENLKEKVAAQEKTIGDFARQLQANAGSEKYVENSGALFKRKPEGGYSETVYCFDCKRPMGSSFGQMPFSCKCGYFVSFTGNDLPRIMAKLPR